MKIEKKYGIVTLATSDGYASGAVVLGRSLRAVGTEAELICMVVSHLSEDSRKKLDAVFDKIMVVDVLNSNDQAMLTLLKRPELGVTLTKLHCWVSKD